MGWRALVLLQRSRVRWLRSRRSRTFSALSCLVVQTLCNLHMKPRVSFWEHAWTTMVLTPVTPYGSAPVSLPAEHGAAVSLVEALGDRYGAALSEDILLADDVVRLSRDLPAKAYEDEVLSKSESLRQEFIADQVRRGLMHFTLTRKEKVAPFSSTRIISHLGSSGIVGGRMAGSAAPRRWTLEARRGLVCKARRRPSATDLLLPAPTTTPSCIFWTAQNAHEHPIGRETTQG